MVKSEELIRSVEYVTLVVKGSGLALIIIKNRLSTRFFAAIFRVVTAVCFSNVPPCSLVVVPPSPSLR